jgi:phosphate transport system substrate-binding protein
MKGTPKQLAVFAALTVLLPLAVSLVGCGRGAGAGIILAGSTSVQPFAEILAEDYMKLYPDVSIDVQGGGSAAGIMAASSGTADIGMSSRALAGDELKLWWVEIARDGLAVIVNPKNPLASLTLAQVRDIYAGTVTNWSLLGGTRGAIHVVAREDGSGTRASFESMIMGKTSITPRAIIQDSNGAVRQVVADDPGAIGFVSLGLVDTSVKALALDGTAATRDNVINGSYGLSRPFLFLARSEPVGKVKQFVDFVLSDAGKKILDTEGLVTSGGNSVQ